MPKRTPYTLTWSSETNMYELALRGQSFQQFCVEDEHSWSRWLATHTSFLFQGRTGSLRAYQESRPRGGDYWYAYHFTNRRLHKRYLGRSTTLSFARLEEIAGILTSEDRLSARSIEPRTAASAEKSTSLPLLHSRHQVPHLPRALVERPRLLKRLDAIPTYPLTLVSASAGWGKTTLLSVWAARSAFPVAWLSLDELDNDSTRFWLSVLSALRNCLPDVGEMALLMLRSSQPPPLTTIVATLLNELSGLNAPTLLLLDDYHLICEQTIHDSLLFLLEHLPPHLHLVLSSRVDPPLALSRFRARGQLLELRDADLRFEGEETTRFLTHAMKLSLSQAEIAELARRTGGWIAGLQLAALSLLHHPDRAAFVQSFSGSHRYVLDYVQEEILARLSPAMQSFVLDISILHRLSAPLCRAVTLEMESQLMLETIERANLFLVPLDDQRHWYRFHDLFREALLSRLRTSQPELIPLLHQRAASFYEAQGEFREAISHRLSAHDFSSAARLMEQAARQFWLDGEAATMYHWAMELPNEVIREHASLLLAMSLYLIGDTAPTTDGQHTRAHKEAQRLMTRVETALEHRENRIDPSIDGTLSHASGSHRERGETSGMVLRRRLLLLHAWCAFREAQAREDYDQMSRVDQQMQQFAGEDDLTWQLIPLGISFIFRCTVQREGALLVSELRDARQRASQAGDRFALFKIMHALVLALLDAGQLRLAYQECLSGLDLLEQSAGSAQVAWHFSVGLAIVLYQWNRLEEVGRVLSTLIHDAVTWQQSDLQVWGYSFLLTVELARGDLAAAQQILQEGEQLAQRQGGALEPSWLTEMRVRWWLARGNVSELADWTAQVVLPHERWFPFSYEVCLLLIRSYIAQQQWTQAVEILERFRSQLDRPGNRFMSVTFLSLYAVALYQAGKTEQARSTAARLFSLTESEGYIRVYLEAGEPMRQFLQTLLQAPAGRERQRMTAVSRSYVTTLLKAFEQEQQRQGRRVEISPTVAHENQELQNIADPSLIEALSHQEQRVLQSICAGRSNREIAGELVVSINTVKAHVKKIYSKLQVRNRIEACHVAQALRLFFEKTFATGSPQSTQ